MVTLPVTTVKGTNQGVNLGTQRSSGTGVLQRPCNTPLQHPSLRKKVSDTKGFWGGVAATPLGVARKSDSYKATPPLQHPLLDAYISVAQYSRTLWLRVPTATGRPSKGPRFYAVTLCEYEEEYGVTSTKVAVGRRWACNTCYSFAPSVWADGPVPEREEQEQEWADWAAKQKENGQPAKTRKMMRITR